MNRFPSRQALAALAFASLVLAACGGGGGGGGTVATGITPPDTGAQTMSGTVTGFGSVIVDGVRIDNHAVQAAVDMEDGSSVPTELQLGQHVDVDHDANMVATAIHVVAEVKGPVDAVNTAAGTLSILGQTITINTDPTAGPVTVFEAPYTSLADVKVADVVEVHGLIKTDASGSSTIQATRIAKKTPDSYNRVSGVIAGLSTTSKTFMLGTLLIDYSSAKLLPDGVTLANGEEVHVSIPLGTITAGTAVKAVVVRVKVHNGDSHSKESELGGAISTLDATAKTFTINGVKVDASAATFAQTGKSFADLKQGTYVVVKGVFGTDGTLKASTIVIRSAEIDTGGQVELHGTILNFVSIANFTLRNVQVDASSATIDSSCTGITLADNVQVEVLGSLTATGTVKATAVACEQQHDGLSIVSREGVVSKVDATAKTFTLTDEKGATTVQWSGTTLFLRVDAATLDGKTVEAEGVLTNGVLQAALIVLASK